MTTTSTAPGDDEDSGPLGWTGLDATIISAPLAAALVQLGVSRQREYLAAATGAQLLRRAPYSRMRSGRPSAAHKPPQSIRRRASLYIVNPPRRQGIATLFPTHALIGELARRLRVLDGEQAFERIERAILQRTTRRTVA